MRNVAEMLKEYQGIVDRFGPNSREERMCRKEHQDRHAKKAKLSKVLARAKATAHEIDEPLPAAVLQRKEACWRRAHSHWFARTLAIAAVVTFIALVVF